MERNTLVRCSGPFQVDLQQIGKKMMLSLGGDPFEVLAAVKEPGGVVRFLSLTPAGDPVVAAELQPAGDGPLMGKDPGVRWIDRLGTRPFSPRPVIWYPAGLAATLPEGPTCRKYGGQ
jgi:hypothetical protein